jgi:hypothetical protein
MVLVTVGRALVRHGHKKGAAANIAGLHRSNDGDIESDHPQGTGLTGSTATDKGCKRQYRRRNENKNSKGQPKPYPEECADDCERSHVGPRPVMTFKSQYAKLRSFWGRLERLEAVMHKASS